MAYEFKLPDIGEGVVEGEIVRWLVNEGDVLVADQPMVEVMTDKATVEIPAPRAGRVLKCMYAVGEICPVGKVLIALDEGAGAAVTAPTSKGRAAVAAGVVSAVAPVGGTPAFGTGVVPALAPDAQDGDVLATPATRKLARELGVHVAQATTSGPGGRVTSDDVRALAQRGPARASVAAAAASAPARPRLPTDVAVPFRGLRRKIAERMSRSKREAAHFTYVEEIDCTTLVAWRNETNVRLASQPGALRLSFLPFIVRATVDALRRFPQLNASLDEAAGEIVQHREIHIGLAAATDDGLMVPVVRHADQKGIMEIAREIERLAEATRSGKATRDELAGSTFTITSLGALGGVLATPIINHPEVAILGVHKISKRPAVIDDRIVIRDLMNLSISVDHRVVDGHEAAQFVAAIKESLEAPGARLQVST